MCYIYICLCNIYVCVSICMCVYTHVCVYLHTYLCVYLCEYRVMSVCRMHEWVLEAGAHGVERETSWNHWWSGNWRTGYGHMGREALKVTFQRTFRQTCRRTDHWEEEERERSRISEMDYVKGCSGWIRFRGLVAGVLDFQASGQGFRSLPEQNNFVIELCSDIGYQTSTLTVQWRWEGQGTREGIDHMRRLRIIKLLVLHIY